jgi:FtsP/CotA-like multicopper oxidase with cupredoxin domain
METKPEMNVSTRRSPLGDAGQVVAQHAAPAEIVDVAPGAFIDLRVTLVTKRIGDRSHVMLAYNGSIPGPTLRVKQGSEIFVTVTNETPIDATVHWHGLRLENRFDGVPGDTQKPIQPGGRYTHRLNFPDPGLYWYHPHILEDYTQEMGLYGNVIVEPNDPDYWPQADREIVLTLDDIVIEDGDIAAFDLDDANHTAMGRFGNVLLIDGETEQRLDARVGEVVRLYLTNTANTRVFNVVLPGARMKLVGGDSGRYEREEWVDDVVIAPSERAIIDVAFGFAGRFALQHESPGRIYELATIDVADEPGACASGTAFDLLRSNADMMTERERVAAYRDSLPEKSLAIVAEMDFQEPASDGPVVCICAMHLEAVSHAPGTCPRCGMKLMPQSEDDAVATLDDGSARHDHADALAGGIEWEDLMPEINRATNTTSVRWMLIDRDSGAENSAIDWTFQTGDQVKVRLVNEMASYHPMHHPFHVHGERFLVLARDDVVEPNLVWKDTVLIRTGETVELLMDASNSGLWMTHCHIPEHMAAGMMFRFRVAG